ncbi:MAG: right-handed parallel beta-helix repeat-containing protein, partial [Bacteroidetes bacterium]
MIIKYILVALLLFISSAIHGQIIFVNASATGNNDGSSWEHSFTNLQDALAAAAYGDTIWVAAGAYTPTSTTIRTVSFHLVDGVKIFGGFTGVETQLSQRDWEANPTILSGDIGVPGDSTDNSYTVVTIEKADSTTVLDGFIIAYGNADNQGSGSSTGPTKSGGGMYIVGTTGSGELRPVIRNCRIEHNHARYKGGGVYMKSSTESAATPYFEQCVIFENSAFTGGGVYIKDGSDNYSTVMNNCTIEKNQALSGGGLTFYNYTGNKNLKLSDCSILENMAVGEGGGIMQESGANSALLEMSNCIFKNNIGIGSATEGAFLATFNFVFSESYKVDSCVFEEYCIQPPSWTAMYIESSALKSRRSTFNLNSTIFFNQSIFDIQNSSFFDGSIVVNESIFQIVNSYFSLNSKGEGVQILIDPNGLSGTLGTSVVKIENSILNPSKDSSGQIISLRQGSSLSLTHSLVNVPQCDSIATPGTNVTCGPGMLYNLDPMFLDTAAGDYRLHPCSPARDAGDNAIIDSLGILTDIAGQPRIQGGTVDMGAWESEAFSIK